MTQALPLPADLLATLDRARSEGRDTLLEPEAKLILDYLGIGTPQQIYVAEHRESWKAAEQACSRMQGETVVVKVVAAGLSHKSELGGVKIVPKRLAAIVAAMIDMRDRLSQFDVRGFLISEYLEHGSNPGSELLLGARWTADFGPIVTLAPGGVYTEFMARNIVPGREAAIFSPGLTQERNIDRTLGGTFIGPIVTGALRSQKPLMPPAELRELVSRTMRFAATYIPETVLEIEINPLVPTAGGAIALDTRVRIGAAQPQPAAERPVRKLKNLLEPKSIAVAGVSSQMNPGRVIVQNLLREGFARERIFVIKPNEKEIDGCACVADIASLPQPVDLLVVSLAAESVPQCIDQVVATQKAETVIVIPGGLGEHAGSDTLVEQIQTTLAKSRSSKWRGPLVNGGNCLGVRSVPGRYDTIFLPQYKLQPPVRVDGVKGEAPVAPLAIVSQSGAFAVSKLTKLGVNPRYVVSIGNQVDLTFGDYLEYLESDPAVEVFAFYVEGFQPLDGRKWLEAAARATSMGRPVILYRAGRTEAGTKATATHTAAIAGDAVVTRELAKAAGVLVADTIEEFEDLVRLFAMLRSRSIAGTCVAAMSNAGFESVALADSLGNVQVARLSDATTDAITAILRQSRLDKIVTVSNPLDVNPLLGDEAFVSVARLLLEDTGVDAAVICTVPLTGAQQTLPKSAEHCEDLMTEESVVSRLIALWRSTSKPWVAVVDGGPAYDPMVRRLEESGVPTFRTADRAMRAFGSWCEWRARWREIQR